MTNSPDDRQDASESGEPMPEGAGEIDAAREQDRSVKREVPPTDAAERVGGSQQP
jgi:hypothetical protein